MPKYGGLRRVPGLRRDEVAQLAGVSTDYYTRLERGATTGVSDSVLEAGAAALLLNEAERAHLMDLARSSGRRPSRPPRTRVRPGVQRMEVDVAADGVCSVAVHPAASYDTVRRPSLVLRPRSCPSAD